MFPSESNVVSQSLHVKLPYKFTICIKQIYKASLDSVGATSKKEPGANHKFGRLFLCKTFLKVNKITKEGSVASKLGQ